MQVPGDAHGPTGILPMRDVTTDGEIAHAPRYPPELHRASSKKRGRLPKPSRPPVLSGP
jgi:hypothetical protein